MLVVFNCNCSLVVAAGDGRDFVDFPVAILWWRGDVYRCKV